MGRGDYEGNFGGCKPSDSRYRNEVWLRQKYVVEGLSAKEIGDICGVSTATITRWRDEYGLEKRDSGGYSDNAKHRNEEWLREHYIERGLSLWQMQELCDVHADTIRRWLGRHGIETRDSGSPKGEGSAWYGKTGSDHVQWQGGQAPYGGGWNERKRERVRERDDYECQECGLSQAESVEKHGMRLHVHHITPAREFDDAEKRNAMDNLIALCPSCHSD